VLFGAELTAVASIRRRHPPLVHKLR
jgi:hypothetical protein